MWTRLLGKVVPGLCVLALGTAHGEASVNWRDLLDHSEVQAMERLSDHPAIAICLARADQGDPVASYHVRKLAHFAAPVREAVRRSEPVPQLSELAFRRPAKAFQWCGQQAGLFAPEPGAALAPFAEHVVRLIRKRESGSRLLAASP